MEQDEAWSNNRDMAERYWMSHQYHLGYYFWCFWRVGWYPMWWPCANYALHFSWGCKTFKLDPTSISYIYKVFDHLLLIRVGIWMNTLQYQALHSFWRVGWHGPWWWPCANYSLHYGWGCKTIQTGSHIHLIYIESVWAPSAVVDRHMDVSSYSYHYHLNFWPRS